MRLKVMFLPDALHRRRTDALISCHQTDAPMRGVPRGAMQGRFHQCGLLCWGDLLRAAGTGSILQNPRQALVSDSFRCTENDPDSQCHALRDATQGNHPQQLPAVFVRNHKRGSRSARHRSLSMEQSHVKVKLFLKHYTSDPSLKYLYPSREAV